MSPAAARGEIMSEEAVVQAGFWGAFLLDVYIFAYAFRLRKRMGSSGMLSNSTLYAGMSAMVFGIHHILELFVGDSTMGLTIAEGIEGIAAVLLGAAVYQLYKLVEE